jgi:hypothetical protein
MCVDGLVEGWWYTYMILPYKISLVWDAKCRPIVVFWKSHMDLGWWEGSLVV